jgi:DNA-binding CsgD family transcriptional regulator
MTNPLLHTIYIAPDLASQCHPLTAPIAVLPGPDNALVLYRAGVSGWAFAGWADPVRRAGSLALVQVRDALYLMRADILPHPAVSVHERAILQGIAAGWQNRAIAAHLHLSEGTINQYLKRLNDRLGAKHRAHLIAIAKDQGRI